MSSHVSLLISSFVLAVNAAPAALSPTFDTLLPRAPDVDNRSTGQRDVPGIIWSCLATTAACTYFAVHPNIPNPASRTYEVKKEQLLLAFYAFIAPEVVILWAMRQRRAAQSIKEEFENPDATPDDQHNQVREASETHRQTDGAIDPKRSGDSQLNVKGTGDNQESTNKYDEWSMTHSFFLQMGGFMIKQEELAHTPIRHCKCCTRKEGQGPQGESTAQHMPASPSSGGVRLESQTSPARAPTRPKSHTYKVLTPAQLRQHGFRIEVSEQEIRDRSKGDLIAKVITVGQTWWFVVHCCARFAQGLDVSILELTTLAFAALNALTWFMWRNKPLHVRLPIYLNQRGERISGPDFEDMRSERRERRRKNLWSRVKARLFPVHRGQRQVGNENPPSESDGSVSVRGSYLDSKGSPFPEKAEDLEDDTKGIQGIQESIPPIQLPHATQAADSWLGRLRRPLLDMIGTDDYKICEFPKRKTTIDNSVYEMENVGRFYVSEIGQKSWRMMALLSAVFGVLFGAIHCVTWAPIFHFPTRVEWLMWEVSAFVITAIPLALFLSFSSHFVYERLGERFKGHWIDTWVVWFEKKMFQVFLTMMRYAGTITYILARLILLGLAISSLRDLTPSTYQSVTWTNFIPHI
ncbi:hypothetical protein AX16_003057 [Volvariella volvacea WC 439]|nr:hypothetical protein AX16_003057 [Volvariella volvacea WC 439]